jgi:FKBP-type peptidyl-prolyl cis-trans isomerase
MEIEVNKKHYFVLLIALMIGTVLFAAGCSKGTSTAIQSTKLITTNILTQPSTTSTIPATPHETAQSGDTVSVDYTLKLADGTVYDTSVGKSPFQFTLGKNQVIVGFEKAVLGMKAGESKTVTIPPEEGYGKATSAGNPLGGKTLTFEIKLLKIIAK